MVQQRAIPGWSDLGPGLEEIAHLLVLAQLQPIGQHPGQAVQRLDGERLFAGVFKADAAQQRADGLPGQGGVAHRDAKADGRLQFPQLQAVEALHHLPLRPPQRGEGLKANAVHAQKGAEALERRILIGQVGRLEGQDGMALVGDAKAGDALAAVAGEGPQRRAQFARQAGQEAGKTGRAVIIPDADKAVRADVKAAHFVSSSSAWICGLW